MGKKDDLDPMGAVRNIADLVNDAISSGDYSSLNRQITEALNEAADAVHDSVTGAVFGNKPFYKTEGGKTYRAESGSSYQQAQEKARHTDGFKEEGMSLREATASQVRQAPMSRRLWEA